MSQGSFHKWLLEMNSKKSAKVPLLVGHAFTLLGDHLGFNGHSNSLGSLGMVLLVVELTTVPIPVPLAPESPWFNGATSAETLPFFVYIHIMWDIGECIIVL